MPPKTKSYWTEVKQISQFLEVFQPEESKLIVLDIYPEWSGPCELMQPTYKSIALSTEDFEKRMVFMLMSFDVIKNVTEFKIDRFACTCKPKFLFILNGKIVDEVNGANISDLSEKILKHIPLSV